MKGPVKVAVLAVAVVVLVGGAFYGGLAYQKAKSTSAATAVGMPAGGGTGGPMADLTEEEQAELENMTAEERQAWMEENMGTAAGGAPGGGATRGGTLEGEVLEVADDSITISLDSGSQTVYIDDNTVIAYVKGASDLAAGSTVMVVSTPSGGGTDSSSSSSSTTITTASLVVVK